MIFGFWDYMKFLLAKNNSYIPKFLRLKNP